MIENTLKPVLCIGGANYDLKMILDDPMSAETSNPCHSKRSYGGVIRNVAENLARLNVPIRLMTLVGQEDAGRQLLDSCAGFADVSASSSLDGEATSTYIAVLDLAGDLMFGLADMNICERMDAAWVLSQPQAFEGISYVVCDTNVQRSALEALVEKAEAGEIKLAVVGVSGPKMKRMPQNLEGVDLLIVNRDESQAYFHTREGQVEKLCQLWLDKGIKRVVVTCGTDPYGIGGPDGCQSYPIVPVPREKVVDVTGAGDSYSAGTLYGILHSYPLREAAHIGALVSALTIQTKNTVSVDLSEEWLKGVLS